MMKIKKFFYLLSFLSLSLIAFPLLFHRTTVTTQASAPDNPLSTFTASVGDLCSVQNGVNFLSVAGPYANYLPLIRTSEYLATFDGNPATPTPFTSPFWDITIHNRSTSYLYNLASMEAMHGPLCEPPPATHSISTYADAVFNCKNHLMTALNDVGYGMIYLAPNVLADFSNGEAIIRFDVSTLRTSERDWIDLRLTPFEDNLQLAADSWAPSLSGEPRNGIHVFLESGNAFIAEVIHNFVVSEIEGENTWIGYDTFLEPSPTRRDTFELRISKDHLTFGMPTYNFWWIDTEISPPLDWDKAVVQFGHHSYDPLKGCPTCTPNTWHWDNVYIHPSKPFTMIKANQRYLDSTTPGLTATFNVAAPQNAYLRFAAVGTNIKISFNNGQTWLNAQRQAAQLPFSSGHFQSYWTPIPAGVTSIRFSGENGWAGTWHIRDISIWAKNE